VDSPAVRQRASDPQRRLRVCVRETGNAVNRPEDQLEAGLPSDDRRRPPIDDRPHRSNSSSR
jgi:hypothetical protein